MRLPLTSRRQGEAWSRKCKAYIGRLLFDGDILRLMIWTLAVKPIGLLTQMFTAKYFGASAEYDAYIFAVFLVSFMDSLSGQTYVAVIVPLTIRLRQQLSREALMRFQTAMLGLFIVPFVLYAMVLLLQGWRIIAIIAPNMPPGTAASVLQLLKPMAFAGVALVTVGLVKAILNANRQYGFAGAMPLLNAVVILGSLMAFRQTLGVWSLAVGFVASNFLQLGILSAKAVRGGSVELRSPALPSGAVAQLTSLGGAFLISQLFVVIGQSMDRFFATGLPEGSISIISYCQAIMTMGTQFFAMSLVVVMFTRIVEYVAAGDMRACSTYLLGNLTRQSRIVVPASLALCLASAEIVRVLFQRGAFDAQDAQRTAGALAIYAMALPATVTNGVVGRTFHALGLMKAKIWLNLQYVVAIIAGNMLLIGHMQVSGLALSATLAINLHLALSLWALHSKRTGLAVNSLVLVLARSYVLAGIVFVVYWGTGYGRWLDGMAWRNTTMGAIAVACLRTVFVFGVYSLGYLLWRGQSRRHSRDSERAATSSGERS